MKTGAKEKSFGSIRQKNDHLEMAADKWAIDHFYAKEVTILVKTGFLLTSNKNK